MDWLASGLVVAGWYLMANHWRWGLVANLAGNLAWLYWGWQGELWSIVCLNLVFVALNVRTFAAWDKRLSGVSIRVSGGKM